MTRNAGDKSRIQILAIIRERRGVHKSELGRLTNKGWGNVGHHVRILEIEGLVQTETRGRLLWIFDGETTQAERNYLVATRTTASRRILEYLGLRQKATIRALSEELAVSKKVIRFHLSSLERGQVVEQLEGHPPTFATTEIRRFAK